MNIKEFSQPTILKGTQYGTTVTIELDHSDTSIDEVMDGMLTIVRGLGYLDTTINEWIKEKSKDIYDDEHQIVKDALADDWFDESDEEDYSGQFKDWSTETPTEDEYGDFVDSNWDEDTTNSRMNIIGQNGNEGLHYGKATDEDIKECEYNELSDLNDDESIIWFDEDEFTPNDVVDMETGEVTYDEDGGFEVKMKLPYQKKATQKLTPKKMDKTIIKKGKIKDLKNGK